MFKPLLTSVLAHLRIAQAKVGPAVMVSGLAPGGAAEQCAAIKVGDELLSVDVVGVRDRDGGPTQARARATCGATGRRRRRRRRSYIFVFFRDFATAERQIV